MARVGACKVWDGKNRSLLPSGWQNLKLLKLLGSRVVKEAAVACKLQDCRNSLLPSGCQNLEHLDFRMAEAENSGH